MIGYLRGEVLAVASDCCLLLVGGVGYQVYLSQRHLATMKQQDKCEFYTWLSVREDALQLFGFINKQEHDVFLKIITVSGVGPKAALAVLSAMTADQFVRAIAGRNSAELLKVPGIGKKTAERLLLELKDKFAGIIVEPSMEGSSSVADAAVVSDNEVLLALQALGYSYQEVSKVLPQLDMSAGVDKMIKQALRLLTR